MKMMKSISILIALFLLIGNFAYAQQDGFSLSAGINYTHLTNLKTNSQPGIALNLNYQKSNFKIMLRNSFYRAKRSSEIRTIEEANDFFELDAAMTSLNLAYVLNLASKWSLSPFVGIGGTYRSTNVVDIYRTTTNEPNQVVSLQTRLEQHFKIVGTAGLELSYYITPSLGLQVWTSYQAFSFSEQKDIMEKAALSNEWMSGIGICKSF